MSHRVPPLPTRHLRMFPRPNLLPAHNRFLSATVTTQAHPKPLALGTALHGASGRIYEIDGLLNERRSSRLMCVYSATSQGRKYVVKNILPDDFTYQQSLQSSVSDCPNLRTVIDTIPQHHLFLYPHLHYNLLDFPLESLTSGTKRKILKQALIGLGALHEKHISHTDIKPDNIMLDAEESCDGDFKVARVQITDLEDAVALGPRKHLKGCLSGNEFWRSPESWTRARQNTPSDVFSFGIVSIYVMLNIMALRTNPNSLNGEELRHAILKRQLSYFADPVGLDGLLHHLGEDNPYFDRIRAICCEFGPGRPMEPFQLWKPMDSEFKDVVSKMTNLDPAGRITAREALDHPWFHRIPSQDDP